MKKSDFYIDIPPELIAQTPINQRDQSKLMHIEKNSGKINHYNFYDIDKLLNKGDLLVFNDSKVIPARLYSTKKDSNSKMEFLLIRKIEETLWEVMAKPGKRAKIGSEFIIKQGVLNAKIRDILENGNRIADFQCSEDFNKIINELGEMPLPPYIKAPLKEKERYQTIYSKNTGSIAAPTAGLHFTQRIFKKLQDKGIDTAYITLHVGLGTFKPVTSEDITQHIMHSEYFSVSPQTAELIKKKKMNNNKVIAVGTTSCRALESIMKFENNIKEYSGYTDIFIYPGYDFKIIDGIITNFHLPESTLIMLTSALAKKENIINAYKSAIENKYRFFSFGDAMIII